MLSQESIHYTKLDVLRTVVIIVSSHILVQILGNKNFFNNQKLLGPVAQSPFSANPG